MTDGRHASVSDAWKPLHFFLRAEQQKFWGGFTDFWFLPSYILNALLRMCKRFSLEHRNGVNWPVPNDNKYVFIVTEQFRNTPIKIAITTTGIPVKNSYFWHRNFPHSLHTQSPVTGQKSMCAKCPTRTVLAASYSEFMQQWRKNAASAEHCTS